MASIARFSHFVLRETGIFGAKRTGVRLLTSASAGPAPKLGALQCATRRSGIAAACRSQSSLPAPSASRQPRPFRRVETVVDSKESQSISLVWNFGEVTSYPYVWLRDSCLCEHCFHRTSGHRSFDIAKLDVNVEPAAVQNDADSQELVVIWPDGHESRFPHDWLAEHAFTKRAVEDRNIKLRRPKPVLWGRKLGQQNFLRVDYKQLMEELPVLQQVLEQLHTFGLLLVTDSPQRAGIVEKICNRIGHLRSTHYGKTFTVKTRKEANNLAYTSAGLPPHLDLAYYYYVPGVQVLHCISQHIGTGGDNVLVDSFNVAEQIRKERPDLFHLLSTTSFKFQDIGHEDEVLDCHFNKLTEHVMFRLDREGNMAQVFFHNPSRCYNMEVPFELVKPTYEGLKMFHDLCMREENHILFKMNDGDVLMMDNMRVMHGRLEYTTYEDKERVLEGGYSDWDEVFCRYRVIKELLGQHSTQA